MGRLRSVIGVLRDEPVRVPNVCMLCSWALARVMHPKNDQRQEHADGQCCSTQSRKGFHFYRDATHSDYNEENTDRCMAEEQDHSEQCEANSQASSRAPRVTDRRAKKRDTYGCGDDEA